MLDHIDKELIEHLQADGRQTASDLAQVVGLSVPAVAERIRKLQEHGIIQGSGMLGFLLASVLLVLVAYIPARTIEKWEDRRAWDFPFAAPIETRGCPRCNAAIPSESKFCAECGSRIW